VEPAALARLMNDGLTGLVARHPDRFPGWVAGLSLRDPDAEVTKAARTVAMGARGFQIAEAASLPRRYPRR
jgi:aminocarboxymuconate-semialdehyde decarboxylase